MDANAIIAFHPILVTGATKMAAELNTVICNPGCLLEWTCQLLIYVSSQALTLSCPPKSEFCRVGPQDLYTVS